MELRPGQKKSEIGVIPVDWHVESLGRIGNIRTGPFGTLLKADEYSSSEGVPLVSVGEIGEGKVRIHPRTPLIPPAVVRRLPEYVLNEGDIVVGRKGAVDRSAMIPAEQSGWFLGSDGLRVRLSRTCHPPFVAWQLQRSETRSWLLQNATGTTMPSMNQQILKRVPIALPPMAEQKAIAATLSDVDALLAALEKVVAKKRDLKQAAMQQLLTGKTRLPGFTGSKWATARLGALCSMKSGIGITSADIDAFSEYPCFGGNGLRGYTSSFTHNGTHVLIGRQGALCGNVQAVEGKFFASEHAVVVTGSIRTDVRWLGYVLGEMRLNQYSESSAQPGLSVSKILNLEVMAPPTREEQSAIAAALSGMDAELAALQFRSEKTRLLKQGMMQELLTGKTRLLPGREAA